MNEQAMNAVKGMLNCFPQTNQDYVALLRTLGGLCAGISDRAIIEAANRFAAGDVEGQSKTFAPSGPEFVAEARRRQEFIDIASRPRISPPVYRSGPLAPFEIRKQQALNKHGHRPVLFTDVSNERWRTLSANGEVPAGSIWVAALATVYGPDPHAIRQVAA